ncbi:MAG: energy-coupling factor ABC transporter ATP-binding protein [Nitrospirae bacterium YQR-1]
MNTPLIEFKNVCYTYPDGTAALTGVNLSIEKGEKTALIGPNGSGKSTLILHLNGLLKPAGGKIFCGGVEIGYSKGDLINLRKRIGVVFQDPESQLFSLTVYQEVSFGPVNMALSIEEVRRRVEQAMAKTEVTHLRDKPAHFLSLGEKKAVSIADIIAMEPEFIVFDEPTSSLDYRHKTRIMEILNNLHDSGVTILLATHDIDLVYAWADHVYVLNEGKIITEGSPEAVFSKLTKNSSVGIAKPVVMEMFQALSNAGLLLNKTTTIPKTKEQLIELIRSSTGT